MVVDVRDEAGRGVEVRVGGFVGAAEVGGGVGEGSGGGGGRVGGCGERGGELGGGGGGHGGGDEGGEGEGEEAMGVVRWGRGKGRIRGGFEKCFWGGWMGGLEGAAGGKVYDDETFDGVRCVGAEARRRGLGVGVTGASIAWIQRDGRYVFHFPMKCLCLNRKSLCGLEGLSPGFRHRCKILEV